MGESPFRRDQRSVWDKEYAKKDPLWKGPSQKDISVPAGARTLELGCGNGKTLESLTRKGAPITALDCSRNAVRTCAHNFAGSDTLDLVIADFCELPFQNGSFAMVIAFHVLGHLLTGDRDKAVSELGRVLSPAGKILVRVFSTEDMRSGKGRAIEENTYLRGPGILYHYFTESELRGLFREFRIESLCRSTTVKKHGGTEYLRVELEAILTRPDIKE